MFHNMFKDGKIYLNEDIGLKIGHSLSSITHLDSQAFDNYFSSNIKDLIMVSYLTNLTQNQLALSDKIVKLL